MQVLRLNEVLTRVVAWHNRHPLARRIQAAQVHSVGEVRLPFASAQPLFGTPAPAVAAKAPVASRTAESLADVVSARAAARPAAAVAAETLPGLELHSGSPEASVDPAAATDLDPFAAEPGRDGSGDGNAATADPGSDPTLDLAADNAAAAALAAEALDTHPDAAAHAATAHAAADPDSATAPPAAALATGDNTLLVDGADRQDQPASFRASTPDDAIYAAGPAPAAHDIDPSSPSSPSAPEPVSAPPPAAGPPSTAWSAAAPLGWFRRRWARLTGRRPGWPRLEAAFSRDFIWPLTPQTVARWAQRHGQPQSLAPADWPRRQVDTDLARLGPLRQAGLPHTVQLHLLTAAIGVGDRRIRLLMDADGHIIGPRAYSRSRSATAAGLLLAALVAAGWPWRGLHPAGDGDGAAKAALATAAAASAASAVALAASAASAPTAPTAPAPHVAALAASTAAAADAAKAASAVNPVAGLATGPQPAPAAGTAHARPAHAEPNHPLAAHPDTPAATAAAPSTTAPITTTTAPAKTAADSGPLGRVRPILSDDERTQAKQQAARLRQAPAAAPAAAAPAPAPATVYAVVTRPSRQRETAASGLAVMRSSGPRLSPPAPGHSELMQHQGAWRAAWWPFANQVDAERARMMLAARGLKAEVVEF